MTDTNPSSAPRTLQESAYDTLKGRILSGEYAPGVFLSSREIADELQMSKTPVNGALARLEDQGYVSISPQRGVVVRAITVQEVFDTYDMRAALETHVVRKLATNLSPALIGPIQANLERQAELLAGGDFPEYVRADAEFHLLLCEASGNHELVRVMQGLNDRLVRVMTAMSVRDMNQVSHDDHVEIFRLIMARDVEGSVQLMNSHLRRATQRWVGRVGHPEREVPGL